MTLGADGLATLIMAFLGFLWNVGRKVKYLAPVLLVLACAPQTVGPALTTTAAPTLVAPSAEARHEAAAAAERLRATVQPPARTERGLTAASPLLDWEYLRDQRAKAWRSFLNDVVDSAEFQAPAMRGCVRGWKSAFGGGTAYGIAGRLLDWARGQAEGSDRTRALAWIREHVLHVLRTETFYPDAGFPRVSGEAGPAVHANPLTTDPIPRDTDLLRHWCLEPYAQAILEPLVPFTDAEREEARRWVQGWGWELKNRTPVASMSVSNVFYEAGHSRFFFSLDNLTWAYLATGDRALLEHAENLLVASLSWTRRGPGTPFPAPFSVWAGSDPMECGHALGNPNAPHRAASCWHVSDSGRRALPLFIVTQRADVKSWLREWVLTQTTAALHEGNPLVRGGELRPDGTAKIAAEGDAVPWALKNPREALGITAAAKYQVLAGQPNWCWDGDYHSTTLPDGKKRYRYTNVLGVMVDASNSFGWPDLWWTRFLLTGDENDRLRALVSLRDYEYWRNAAGPYVLVTVNGRSGFPYNGGNIGRSRSFAWAMEAGSLIPWDVAAEGAIASLR